MASSSLGWEEGTLGHTEDLNSSLQTLWEWQDLRRKAWVNVDVFKSWALINMVWGAEARLHSGLHVVSGWTLGRGNLVVSLSQTPFLFS